MVLTKAWVVFEYQRRGPRFDLPDRLHRPPVTDTLSKMDNTTRLSRKQACPPLQIDEKSGPAVCYRSTDLTVNRSFTRERQTVLVHVCSDMKARLTLE
ncbi:unnamed protein product [Arctogadus glacialis]